MLSESEVQSFHEAGYLVSGKVLTDIEVEQLRERLDRVIAGSATAKPELLRNLAGARSYGDAGGSEGGDRRIDELEEPVVVQIVNIWEADELFFKHLYHPVITGMVAQLCRTDVVRVWHDQIQYKPPRHGTMTPWHQDWVAWRVMEPADLVSAWVALDDVSVENGCMWMVPGSHRWGSNALRTNEAFELTCETEKIPKGTNVKPVPIEIKAGECAFHHCMTWHGSNKNPSDRPRRAIAVHYMPGYTRFVPQARHAIDHRIEVQPGELLQGKYFPKVWDNGPLPPPAFETLKG